MLPPSHMFWVPALGSPPQRLLQDLARRSAHSHVPNLLASDQTPVESLFECLTDEVPLDRTGLDQVKDRPQRASKLEALRGLYIAFGQIGLVKHEDAGNIAVAPEARRDGHIKLRRVHVGQVVKAKRRLMSVHPLHCLVPVPGPQCHRTGPGRFVVGNSASR
jgi:hypothetical protein